MTGKSQAEGGADLVLRGARVITMNPVSYTHMTLPTTPYV